LALVGAWGEVRGRRGRGFDSMVQVGRGVR
jgi:hypothetical protein